MKKELVALILILGCCITPPTSQGSVDLSIIQDQSCQLPCWHGIIPGKTSIEEASTIIETLPDINRDTIKESVSSSALGTDMVEKFMSWESLEHSYQKGWLFSGDGIVDWIEVDLPRELKLGDIVAVYGPPGGVIARNSGELDGYFLPAVAFFFPEEQFEILVRLDRQGRNPQIEPDLSLTGGRLRIEAVFNREPYVAWEGYRSFEYYYQEWTVLYREWSRNKQDSP